MCLGLDDLTFYRSRTRCSIILTLALGTLYFITYASVILGIKYSTFTPSVAMIGQDDRPIRSVCTHDTLSVLLSVCVRGKEAIVQLK